MRKLLLVLLLLAVIAAGAAYYALAIPFAGFDKEAFVTIPPRTGTREIAQLLQKSGVIQSEWQFLVARGLNRSAKLTGRRVPLRSSAYAARGLPQDPARRRLLLRTPHSGRQQHLRHLRRCRQTRLHQARRLSRDRKGPNSSSGILRRDAPSLEGYLFPPPIDWCATPRRNISRAK